MLFPFLVPCAVSRFWGFELFPGPAAPPNKASTASRSKNCACFGVGFCLMYGFSRIVRLNISRLSSSRFCENLLVLGEQIGCFNSDCLFLLDINFHIHFFVRFHVSDRKAPQLVSGSLDRWHVKRVGHGSAGRNDSRINREIRNSNSKRRLSVSLQYIPQKRNGAFTPE